MQGKSPIIKMIRVVASRAITFLRMVRKLIVDPF